MDIKPALVVDASQIKDLATEGRVEVLLPVERERMPGGRGSDPGSSILSCGAEVALIRSAQLKQGAPASAAPHFRFPSGVERLDQILDPVLAGWREDGRDAEAQAHAGHAADGVPKLVRALEEGVVVELGVVGEPVLPPVPEQTSNHVGGGPPFHQKRGRKSPVERDSGQNVEAGAGPNHQILDEVEAVELGGTSGDPG